MVGDAAYASGRWRGLPGRVTVTSRLRSDAALGRHTDRSRNARRTTIPTVTQLLPHATAALSVFAVAS